MQIKKIIIWSILLAAMITVWYFNMLQYLSLSWIQANKNWLFHMASEHYWLAVVTFMAIYILANGLALPGTFILTMSGGLLFGVISGTVYVVISATIGALMAFTLSRYLLSSWVYKRYSKQLGVFNTEIARHGTYYFLVIRIVLVLPFFLVNLLSGLTNVSWYTFAWTTAVGIIPAVAVYTYTGRELLYVQSARDLISYRMIIAFTLIALLLLIPVLVQSVLNKKKKSHVG